jgi:transcriptional regulator with XRE-family HTH domain
VPREVRTHLPETVGAAGDATSHDLTPKHLTKAQFGQRVYRLMLRRGWTQSELSRRADLGRDLISAYVRGIKMPTPQNADKLATALGVTVAELLPNHLESAIEEDAPAFEMKASVHAPDKAWLRVNQLVSIDTALKVGALLRAERDDVANRS